MHGSQIKSGVFYDTVPFEFRLAAEEQIPDPTGVWGCWIKKMCSLASLWVEKKKRGYDDLCEKRPATGRLTSQATPLNSNFAITQYSIQVSLSHRHTYSLPLSHN
jgi:hypothetical protein